MPTYCFPTFRGVPGSLVTKLDWWTLAAPPGPNNFPEDPNWLGAFSISHSSGAGVHTQFRVLNGVDGATRFLWLSWIVRVAPNPTLNIDGINLLLGVGGNHIALKIRLATTATTISGSQAVAFAVQTNSYSAGTLGAAHGTIPAWVTNTGRMWINYTSPASGLSIPWAFQIAVPLEQNLSPAGEPAVVLPRGADFKLWYQAQVNTLAGAGVVPYPWTGTPFSTSELDYIPAGLTPADVRVPTVASDPACTTGIVLNWADIGIKNADGTDRADRHAIQLDLGKPYPPNNAPYNTGLTPDVSQPQRQNMFYARPNVASLSAAQMMSLRARFRLANWGSQYHVPTPNSWKTVPGGEAVNYSTADSEFRFTWPRPPLDAFTSTFINGVKTWLNTGGASGQHPHQCMLVELSSTDPSVIFTKSSEFANMHVVDASVFERVAEISVVGLAPISPRPRDVYLYLETFNMPRVADGPYLERMAQGWGNRMSALASRRQINTVDDVIPYVPSYRIHAYHDTGKMLELEDGSSVRILTAQTSFGYFVQHKGELYGWESRLYGAVKLADDFYVSRAPNNGAARVVTAIQARESANEAPLPETRAEPELIGCLEAIAGWLEQQGSIGQFLAALIRRIAGSA